MFSPILFLSDKQGLQTFQATALYTQLLMLPMGSFSASSDNFSEQFYFHVLIALLPKLQIDLSAAL